MLRSTSSAIAFPLVAVLLLAAQVVYAERTQTQVVGITDGDRVTALTAENKQIRVRLAGMDTSERGQPCGNASKQALSDFVFCFEVALDEDKVDRYGRLEAKVWHDGRHTRPSSGCKFDQILDRLRYAEFQSRS